MLRSELIALLAEENPTLKVREVERIVDVIFDEIASALERGDRVELRGFGAFSVRKREARTGRNPRTGNSVSVEAKHVPFFKAGKELKQRVDRPSPEFEAPAQASAAAVASPAVAASVQASAAVPNEG